MVKVRATRQRGAALITVLLIMAVAGYIATSMFNRAGLDRRRTENFLFQDQAYLYAQSAEEAVIALLVDDLDRDLNDDNNSTGLPQDDLEEDWYELQGYQLLKTFNMPDDGALVSSELVDLQGRFNLNDLRSDTAEASSRFLALLTDLEIPAEGDPAEIVLNVRDWLDADDQPLAYDAEDLYYATLEMPYRTANNYMASVSELRLVRGLTEQDIEKLAPYVTVLPEGTTTNINTVSGKILATYDGIKVIDDILEGQAEGGYAAASTAFNGMDKAPPPEWFSVYSSYFLLEVKASLGNSTVVMQSVIYRPPSPTKEDPVRVIKRDRARQFKPLVLESENG
jgi:general secretion pathway protein K